MRRQRMFPMVAVAGLVACLGKGPVPVPGSDAQVLFVVDRPEQDVCDNSRYISAVATATGSAFVTLLPYVPQSSNNGGCPNQSTQPAVNIPIYQIDYSSTATQASMPLAMSGGSSNGSWQPRMLINNMDELEYLYLPDSTGGAVLQIGSDTTQTFPTLSPNTTNTPLGMVKNPTGQYIALGTQVSGGGIFTEPNSPTFPSSTNPNQNQNQGGTGGALWQFFPASGSNPAQVTQISGASFDCDASARCIAATPSYVYWLGQDQQTSGPTGPSIQRYPSSSNAVETFVSSTIASFGDVTGFGTGLGGVAWSIGDFPTGADGHCEVDYLPDDAPPNTAGVKFVSSKYSCMGVAVENDGSNDIGIYFTTYNVPNNDDSNNGGNNVTIQSEGVGRVDLVTGETTLLQLGLSFETLGVRRVLGTPDGLSLLLVDPFVIATIPIGDVAIAPPAPQ